MRLFLATVAVPDDWDEVTMDRALKNGLHFAVVSEYRRSVGARGQLTREQNLELQLQLVALEVIEVVSK